MYPKTFTDQMDRQVRIEKQPLRIISLVPSQTELLFDLGLDDEVVGITKFCIHPEEKFKEKAKVGGTKKLDFEKIASLNPDLIIGNKEENEEQQIKELMQHYPVWMSDIHHFDDALEMIRLVGDLVSRSDEANEMANEIDKAFQQLTTENQQPVKAAYFIWKDPYMVAAKNTFIDDILHRTGWVNAFAHLERYPEITESQLQTTSPQLILLSSEPYPFKEKHIEELQAICPSATVRIVDGELFSWYGSRLRLAPAYLQSLVDSVHL